MPTDAPTRAPVAPPQIATTLVSVSVRQAGAAASGGSGRSEQGRQPADPRLALAADLRLCQAVLSEPEQEALQHVGSHIFGSAPEADRNWEGWEEGAAAELAGVIPPSDSDSSHNEL